MDVKLSDAEIEQLLAHFAEAALGLELPASKPTVSPSDQFEYPGGAGTCGRAICVSWQTDRGAARICGVYDSVQSLRIRAHVLWLVWWLPTGLHYEGWWRCDQKRPKEWTKGRGRDLNIHRGFVEPDGDVSETERHGRLAHR